MKLVRLAAVAVALVALAGCEVYSSAPMGEEVVSITASDWEGFWLTEDGPVAIEVVNVDAGELMISGIDLRQQDDGVEGPPNVWSNLVYLRRSGGWLFGSVENEDEPGLWEWARIKKDGDQLIIWAPRGSAFRELVSEGVLPGIVERGEYASTTTLGELSPAHYELITSGARGVLLDWEDPFVLRRIH
jgi:hypothetical protein